MKKYHAKYKATSEYWRPKSWWWKFCGSHQKSPTHLRCRNLMKELLFYFSALIICLFEVLMITPEWKPYLIFLYHELEIVKHWISSKKNHLFFWIPKLCNKKSGFCSIKMTKNSIIWSILTQIELILTNPVGWKKNH